MKVKDFVWQAGVQFISPSDKEETLRLVLQKAVANPHVSSAQELIQAVYTREEIISTGIGRGVAIPHAKVKSVDDFFITCAVLGKGVDWAAIDDEFVSLVFLIAGPEGRQSEYLQLLSALSQMVKQDDTRKALLNSKTPEEIVSILTH